MLVCLLLERVHSFQQFLKAPGALMWLRTIIEVSIAVGYLGRYQRNWCPEPCFGKIVPFYNRKGAYNLLRQDFFFACGCLLHKTIWISISIIPESSSGSTVIRFTILPKNNKEKSAILRRQWLALTKSCGCIPGKVNKTQKHSSYTLMSILWEG